MYQRSLLLAIPAVLIGTGVAFAEPATPEGAEALVAVFQTYLGATEGVVSVEPGGEAYTLTLDFAPLIALLPPEAGTASLTPVVMELTDQGDGTWEVTQDQALGFTISVPGQMEMSISIGNLASTGVFDVALSAFTESSSEYADIAVKQTMSDPNGGQSNVSYTIDSGTLESAAAENAVDGVDSTTKYSLTGISETFTLPGFDPSAPPSEISLTAAGYSGDGTITGLRPQALYQLMAFFVANPSKAAITGAQAELKAILTKGVPLFDSLRSQGTIATIAVATPMGEVGIEQAGIAVEANGIVEAGLIREAFSFSGLSLPAGMVPDWAAVLVPTSFAIDFKASRFNLAAPMAMLLGAIDLAKPEPVDPAMNAALLAALLPDGVVDITLAPGNVTAGIYDLRFEGVMSAGPGGVPTGTGRVTAKGIPEVQAALSEAPPEISGQMLPVLSIAAGMAKPGDDGALVWEIDASKPGTLMVNGTDLVAMFAQ